MRTTTAAALALLSGLGLALPAAAQQQQGAQQQQQGQQGQAGQQQATTGSGTEVTGVVTSASEQTGEIVIDGQTYVVSPESGTVLMPAEGDRVTLFYEEQGGQKMVTRIGQPRQ